MSLRPVKRLALPKPTIEGAGVHLCRAFGFGDTREFDPFFLLDDFCNDVPEDCLAGFHGRRAACLLPVGYRQDVLGNHESASRNPAGQRRPLGLG